MVKIILIVLVIYVAIGAWCFSWMGKVWERCTHMPIDQLLVWYVYKNGCEEDGYSFDEVLSFKLLIKILAGLETIITWPVIVPKMFEIKKLAEQIKAERKKKKENQDVSSEEV